MNVWRECHGCLQHSLAKSPAPGGHNAHERLSSVTQACVNASDRASGHTSTGEEEEQQRSPRAIFPKIATLQPSRALTYRIVGMQKKKTEIWSPRGPRGQAMEAQKVAAKLSAKYLTRGAREKTHFRPCAQFRSARGAKRSQI